MAKSTEETPSIPTKPTRIQLSRYEREQRTRKVVVIGAAAVAGIVLIMVLLAVLQITVWEPSRAVARVGPDLINVTQLQRRMKFEQAVAFQQYERMAGQVAQLQQQAQGNDQSNNFLLNFYQQQMQQLVGRAESSAVASAALDNLVTERLVRQESVKRGIAVSSDEVQKDVEKTFGLYRETLTPFPTDTPVPTSTPAPTATSTNTAVPTATSTNTPAPTATSTNTPAPTATATAAVTATVAISGTVTATNTAIPTSSPTSAPTASATSKPTTAPSPTATATATKFVTPTVMVIEPTATPRLQPTTVTQDDFKVLFDRTLGSYSAIGFTEADYRTAVENNLYQEKLKAAFAKEVPNEAKHYKYDYIRFNTEDAAKAGLDKLGKGVSMEALISETNNITQPAPIGNGVSANDTWISQFNVEQQTGPAVLAQLETLPIDKPSGVISSTTNGQPGFFVLMPKARETRALEANELKQMQEKAYGDWLEKTRTDASIVKREIEPITLIPADIKRASDNFMQRAGTGAPQ